jgi:Tfp pilus assembly protein PilF
MERGGNDLFRPEFWDPIPVSMRNISITTRGMAMLAAVSLAVFLLAGCGESKVEPSEAQLAAQALERGLQAHSSGDLATAAAAYREALAHDAEDKFAYYNLGLIDQSEGRAEFAESNYRMALSIDPNYVPALFNLAILRVDAEAGPEAVDLYGQVIALDPANAVAHLNLGLLLIDLGKPTQGNKEVATAVDLDPSLLVRVPEETQSPGAEAHSDGALVPTGATGT